MPGGNLIASVFMAARTFQERKFQWPFEGRLPMNTGKFYLKETHNPPSLFHMRILSQNNGSMLNRVGTQGFEV